MILTWALVAVLVWSTYRLGWCHGRDDARAERTACTVPLCSGTAGLDGLCPDHRSTTVPF